MRMRITLNGLRSIDYKVDARWLSRKVWIWSREHGLYWRPKGEGYTHDKTRAGIWPFEEAFAMTKHCEPEKRIEYVAAPKRLCHANEEM